MSCSCPSFLKFHENDTPSNGSFLKISNNRSSSIGSFRSEVWEYQPRKMTTGSQVNDTAMIVTTTNVTTTIHTSAPQAMALVEKRKKFPGVDFKRWKQKMFFYLTTLCLQ
ncbi:hypothetical protein P3L10_026766 [Capsicum annuum]|uniref:uncharacterized protein LOC107842975 n=1 Tax=Capsicum annuum TaxID=4072 RepID=UPI0007BEE63B|nr:uncharacterized protein LOC107842975 [Capsicum annuum]